MLEKTANHGIVSVAMAFYPYDHDGPARFAPLVALEACLVKVQIRVMVLLVVPCGMGKFSGSIAAIMAWSQLLEFSLEMV